MNSWIKNNPLKTVIVGGVAGYILFRTGKFAVNLALPRGIRNNNPGNIRITKTLFSGEVPLNKNSDGSFKQFYDYTDGVRAMIGLIDYHYRQGKDTIKKLITTWAPPIENDTNAYINDVVSKVGIKPENKISANYLSMKNLVSSIIKHENGIEKLTDIQFYDAWEKSKNIRLVFK